MNKIIVIGCPGSGKSTLSFRLKKLLKFPTLHLDKIYHIDNERKISTEEFVEKINTFAKSSDKWIIDGNFITTIEDRIKLADTVILLDIDSQICVNNAIARSKKARQEDMAAGFDISKLTQDFLDYIASFKQTTLPEIMGYYEKYKDEKEFIILKDYDEMNAFYDELEKSVSV